MKKNTKLKVVVGLGKTGFSCVRFLVKHDYNVAVVDSREQPPYLSELQTSFPDVPVHLGSFAAESLSQADELIVSPGVYLGEPAIDQLIKKGIPAIGDIELFARAATAPIVAITGSNGKSTVTTLVGEMAKCAGLNVKVGGNLGTPALDLLDEAAELYVLELSSFQLETTYSLKAAAAVVLNISSDHMDRYQNIEEYTAAKMHIYDGCQTAILSKGQPVPFPFRGRVRDGAPQTITFGLDEPQANEFGIKDNYLAYADRKLLAIDKLKIKGQHQVANALAALGLGSAVKLPMSAMLQALQEFTGLPHRCQWVAKIDEVDWYNDSKGTNVGATEAAIVGFGTSISGKIVLIAGGQGKDADFSQLFAVVKQYVRSLVLIGEDAPKLQQALAKATKIELCDTMQQAVITARQCAQPDDIVLLSPACASFDMFKNFEQRGEVFVGEALSLTLPLKGKGNED